NPVLQRLALGVGLTELSPIGIEIVVELRDALRPAAGSFLRLSELCLQRLLVGERLIARGFQLLHVLLRLVDGRLILRRRGRVRSLSQAGISTVELPLQAVDL